MKKVVVAGSGVLGSQIAFQTAFHHHQVVVYDLKDEFLEKGKEKIRLLFDDYKRDLNATQEQLDAAFTMISYSSVLREAVQDADIVIEAIPENIQIKKDFYIELGALAPDKTIFCTNSSTLLPSQFAAETARPEKFLALHFLNGVWKNTIVEVMRHQGTAPAVFEEIVAFSKSIGLTPLQLRKEQPGYITNSLSVPWVAAALRLWADDVADFQTIDKTWNIGMNTKFPPFAFIDAVGLNTAYNIMKNLSEQQNDSILEKGANRLKEDYIEKGKLGVSTGEGFYKYPNPAYLDEQF
ncbi:3-hydroxyacyl-CoA dehydrogenase [Epilithonimonas hungarica]|uniref:3-hydroxybutyryl-CoA dehydrogenase n=1 Tax=Epilithonimonas hungarica TaxID=454006 RepID=A0A1G7S4T4_9FLAO|nr:3-hydroxyacyl-CoA dehydrogenase [Epilithonimonas hungarica]SDG18027.1 3-hydroxybutyryl-CoA dehydrogenase [Epilithonimonas hungarica]